MNMQQKFAQIISQWDLSQSPFYKAWTVGTLSADDLRVYASEYGAFIALLPEGWKTLGDKETEHEELEHYELWEKFAGSIEAKITEPRLTSTKKLMVTAHELFSRPATSIGAMYAFEVQQPATAQSKLKGLQEKYAELNADEEYFEEHSHNEHEAEKLLKMAEHLSSDDQEQAFKACESMSKALWGALDGIYSRPLN
jgi:pyrroloquinoline quinone (PQQ) biosynthesis protein C